MAAKRVHTLALFGLVLVGCAAAHPLYEAHFDRAIGSLTGPERWMLALTTRYNCDTVGLQTVSANVPSRVPAEPRVPVEPGVVVGGRDARGRPITMANPRAGRPSGGSVPGVPLGQTACQLAGVFPRTIRVWKTDDGIREDWLASLLTYQFEGPDPLHLRLVAVLRGRTSSSPEPGGWHRPESPASSEYRH
jgi:hypothetical protein